MRIAHIATALIGCCIVPAAIAQAAPVATASAPGLAVGTTVYDPQGDEVGKIDSVSGEHVVVYTGTHRATLAASSFVAGAKGPVVNTTKAQLDAAVAEAAARASAALDTALVAGADVRSQDGIAVGQVKEVTGDQVILDWTGTAVALTRQHFAADAQGLLLRMTAEQFQTAAKAAISGTTTAAK